MPHHKSPLLVKTDISCNYNNSDANMCSIVFTVSLENTLTELDITDLDMTMHIPEYNVFSSFEFTSTKKKVKASVDLQARVVNIRGAKLKSHSAAHIDITIKVFHIYINMPITILNIIT
jgi:hypothetical protein